MKLMRDLFQSQLSASASLPSTCNTATIASATPTFQCFDSTIELWTDYLSRFATFAEAHSIQASKLPQVFLTNQSPTIYKLLSNLASQETPPKGVNELSMDQIKQYMKQQFDPKRFVVRERFRFWSEMKRKPGETILELSARIRQAAATCDFQSIDDPLDEALRTQFICSVNNEAVLKALFKVGADELTFARAVEIAAETEDAAKVAKETVFGPHPSIQMIKKLPSSSSKPYNKKDKNSDAKCYRCGKSSHLANVCRHKDSICNFCRTKGHLEVVCQKKIRAKSSSSTRDKIKHIEEINSITQVPKLQIPVFIQSKQVTLELDTATSGNFISEKLWSDLGKPVLNQANLQYRSASKHELPIVGIFEADTRLQENEEVCTITYNVSKIKDLNLLGRDAMATLGVSIDKMLYPEGVNCVVSGSYPDPLFQEKCAKLCEKFPDLFKSELGCLQSYELEIEFKDGVIPKFCKPRSVPFALQSDLAQAYDSGIAQGIWTPVQFNDWGTPVVPIRKRQLSETSSAPLRVCGDYSVTVNPQLEVHRHPLPLPEQLMRRLSGGYGFTKIDLADAYNQIKLGPESRRRLALSTHRGVLLQNVLPFGISSAPGYFQKIMDDLTSDLPGVTVYLDDLLVSGVDAEDHLRNLEGLLERLQSKGLRCRKEKCQFAKPKVEYLGHVLSNEGISMGGKVDAVRAMPVPNDVTGLRSFLGSVQFYSKFLPPNFSTLASPLYQLLRNNVPWKWDKPEQEAFDSLKQLLSSEKVLVHFDPSIPLGISCDASNVGIGATLFHRYENGDERPIANVSKTLTSAQRNYSQIQKEALAIIFALKKFYQYIFARNFILVTDHKPLVALFGPTKPIPGLAANRLARWALFLNQFSYTIEYRKTSLHQNADVLSRLPSGDDASFDREEGVDDVDIVCAINALESQIKPTDSKLMKTESMKDPVLAQVMRYVKEGWPYKMNADNPAGKFRKLSESLSTCHGCLLYGSRLVIPSSLRQGILQILHTSHLGMQRMKQLARTAVFWPGIDNDIVDMCRGCVTCAEHQNAPPRSPVHPWILPEKPWSRLHIDHAINFMGQNWLVVTDAYTKYPCIHSTTSVSSKSTIDLLEEDFAHFGYPHSIVSDNATSFTSEEFQTFCKDKGIVHLTGAPYHPATNGAAERLIQTFKQAVRKSSSSPKKATLEFLMQYRRTPTTSGYSPSELLNNRQLRTKIDTLIPSPAHIAQGKLKVNNPSETKRNHMFKVGDHCYTLHFGPRRNQEPRWVPAVVVAKRGARMFNVRVTPRGPIWRRHLDQLRPRYFSAENLDPGEDSFSKNVPSFSSEDCRTPDPGEASTATCNTRFSHEDCRTPDPGEPPNDINFETTGNVSPDIDTDADVSSTPNIDNFNTDNETTRSPPISGVRPTCNDNLLSQCNNDNLRRSTRDKRFPAHLNDFV